jgi:hypothetical protein
MLTVSGGEALSHGNSGHSLEAREHCYKYDLLDPAQQAHFIEAIGAAKDEYLLAFSESNADLVKDTAPDSNFDAITLPNLRATHLSFAAIPVTIEEVDQCFDSFIKDPKFAEIVGNQSLEEQFRAFKVARASCGVEETEASHAAIAAFSQELGLSA